MTAALIAELCEPIDLDLDCADLFALLPGGVEVGGPPSRYMPITQDCARDLVGLLNSALAPLTPIFNVLDALLCVIEIVKAIPDALGPPPDPTKLARKLAECAEKFDKLLSIVPALSVPRMVKGIIAIILSALRGLRTEMQRIIDYRVRLNTAGARAELLRHRFPSAADELAAAVTCGAATAAAMMVACSQNAKPLNRIIGILNPLLSLAGLDPIPSRLGFGSIPEEALAPIDAVIQVLTAVRQAIP